MIIGEIQRYLRDDGMIKVSRSIRELNFKIRHASDQFMKNNERQPTIQEMAELLDVTFEDVLLAVDAMRDPASLQEQMFDHDGDSLTLMDQLKDDKSEQPFEYVTLKSLIHKLAPRERAIIYLRYYADLTQTEIAEKLGISQVQVSRIEKKVLAKLKSWMEAAKLEKTMPK